MHVSWDLIFVILAVLGSIRSTILRIDSGKTFRAVESLADRLVARCMNGNRLRDTLRCCAWYLFLVFTIEPWTLTDLSSFTRRMIRDATIAAVFGLLWASGESDASERRHLYREHREDAEQKALNR